MTQRKFKNKKILITDKLVLLCGTSCHILALQSYLNKEYDNLITVDFICRSINALLVFRRYIEELKEEYDSEVEYVQLKNKKT